MAWRGPVDPSARCDCRVSSAPEHSTAYDPFAGGTSEERARRLIGAFKLEDTGTDGDFYKRSEREIIREVCKSVAGDDADIATLLRRIRSAKMKKFADDERRAVQTMASRTSDGMGDGHQRGRQGRSRAEGRPSARAARGGLRPLPHHGCVPRHRRRMLVELADTVLREPPASRGEHVFLAVDEMRSMVPAPLVSALTTAAGAGMTMALAYQSVLDVRNLDDKRLDAGSVEGAINVNCQLKALHGSIDRPQNG